MINPAIFDMLCICAEWIAKYNFLKLLPNQIRHIQKLHKHAYSYYYIHDVHEASMLYNPTYFRTES
jgi:hypothetical protein